MAPCEKNEDIYRQISENMGRNHHLKHPNNFSSLPHHVSAKPSICGVVGGRADVLRREHLQLLIRS